MKIYLILTQHPPNLFRKMDDDEIKDLLYELLENKWLSFIIDQEDSSKHDFDTIYKPLIDILNKKAEIHGEDEIRWYARKFLFWLNQLTPVSSSDNVPTCDFDECFINTSHDWDEIFSGVSFGDSTNNFIIMMSEITSDSLDHISRNNDNNYYNIMYNRYTTYFDQTTTENIIDGILYYSWLIASELNLDMESDEFYTIVRTKHNMIVSSLENNIAKDNLVDKILNGEIQYPQMLGFMSRQQLLPEFHGKRAQMILTRAEAEDSEIIDPEKMEDGFYECKKCGKRKTKHYEMQTRSADEPMTIFVICYLCHTTWKEM